MRLGFQIVTNRTHTSRLTQSGISITAVPCTVIQQSSAKVWYLPLGGKNLDRLRPFYASIALFAGLQATYFVAAPLLEIGEYYAYTPLLFRV